MGGAVRLAMARAVAVSTLAAEAAAQSTTGANEPRQARSAKVFGAVDDALFGFLFRMRHELDALRVEMDEMRKRYAALGAEMSATTPSAGRQLRASSSRSTASIKSATPAGRIPTGRSPRYLTSTHLRPAPPMASPFTALVNALGRS